MSGRDMQASKTRSKLRVNVDVDGQRVACTIIENDTDEVLSVELFEDQPQVIGSLVERVIAARLQGRT